MGEQDGKILIRLTDDAVNRLIGPAAKKAYFDQYPPSRYDQKEVDKAWHEWADPIAEDNDDANRQSAELRARAAAQEADYQKYVRHVPARVVPVPPKPIDVDWYRDAWNVGSTYSRMKDAIGEFHIRSAPGRANDGQQVYLIQSDNIFLQVPILSMEHHVAGDRAYLNGWTDEQGREDKAGHHGIVRWRTKKSQDDEYAYGKTIDEMYFKSNRTSYFLSEQHAVWAMGASARTGCFIPPEFFAEIEVNGGTAGNGPDVLPAGNIGEPMSTIAMAHDADWLIGRIFGEGPLAGLFGFGVRGLIKQLFLSRTSLKAMGSAGLFYAATIRHILARAEDNTSEEMAVRDDIDRFLDSVQHLYRQPQSLFLNQDATQWRVKYRRNHSHFQTAGAVKSFVTAALGWIGAPVPIVVMTDLMIESAIQEFTFDEKDNRVLESTTVRDNNFRNRKTPYFPKKKDGGP